MDKERGEVNPERVQHGHNREPCFFGEENYHAYLRWLGEVLHKAKIYRAWPL